MSAAAESAHVRIILADYVAEAQQGKLTIVGAGVSIVGVNVQTGLTAPLAVVATATFDPQFLGDHPAMELSLETDGQLVQLPGATDEIGGEPQYLRVAASEQLKPTVLPGATIPTEAIRPKAQMMMHFQSGLPLAPGHLYTWRVKIDYVTRDEWTESMYVPTLNPGPVIG
jgi:hypothetical protein